MTLSKKILMTLIPIIITSVVIVFFIQAFYIYPVFTQLEQDDAVTNFNRVVSQFDKEIAVLDSLNKDWASWDESYAFIQGTNSDYLDSNLSVETFQNGDFDFMFIVDEQHRLRWHGLYNEDQGNVVENFAFVEEVVAALKLTLGIETLYPADIDSDYAGFVLLPNHPLIYSIRPILSSRGEGPAVGYMIRGKYIDDAVVTEVADQTKVNFQVFGVDQNDSNISPELSVKVIDEQTLQVSRYIFNNNVPVILIQSYLPRSISLQGKVAVESAVIAVALFGLVVLAVSWYTLKKLVLLPISRLTEGASIITETQNYQKRINVKGDDEISLLARQLNSTLTAIETRDDKLNQALEEVRLLSVTDSLTKIPNRLKFDSSARVEWRRMLREQLPLSVIMCDVDFFKQYNDYYGHVAGDKCLTQIAQTLYGAVARPADLVARYGGEEFVILLPGTDGRGAEFIAQKLLSKVLELNIPHEKSDEFSQITVSLGVATTIPQESTSLSQLLTQADAALYQVKQNGRNGYKISNTSLS